MRLFFQHNEFYLYDFKLVTNDKYINQSEVKENCEVNTREKPCKSTPYVGYFLTTELKNPWLTVKGVNVKSNKIFMDQTFNLCVVDKMPMINIFMNIFYEMLKANMNFEMKCPFKPVSSILVIEKFRLE